MCGYPFNIYDPARQRYALLSCTSCTRSDRHLHRACEMCGRTLHHKHFSTELYSVICRACFVKESRMPTFTTTDLTAFCATCPAANAVTAVLTPLGFTLVFQMDA